MTIPQPLQQYCDSFMQQLVSLAVVQNMQWWQSLYTEINRKSLNQCWYEHAILFPIAGDSTEFCVELNYEPKLGLRCAYGIRKDKPKKRKYDASLVSAFKGYSSSSSCFEAEKYSSYKLQERLDPDHWIVWRFLPLSFADMDLVAGTASDGDIPMDISTSIYESVKQLADEINKFFTDWRNKQC